MHKLFYTLFIGLIPSLSLAAPQQNAPAPHQHAEGEACTGDHEHQHAEGEACTGDHEHQHAEGEACTGDHEHQHAEGEACTGDHSSDKTDMIPVKIDEKARLALDMQFEKVGTPHDQIAKSLSGQMMIPGHAVTTYALPAAGKVTFFVKAAQDVKKGDLLYTLSSPDIVEQLNAVEQAKADIARQNSELATLEARRKSLADLNTANNELNTTIRFKQAEGTRLLTTLRSAESRLAASINGAVIKDNLLYFHAAENGNIRTIGMTQGSWGEQGAPALVLTTTGVLEFSAPVYGTDAPQYEKALLTLTGGSNREALEGTLRITAQTDNATKTRTLYFTPKQLPADAYDGQLGRLDLYRHGKEETGYISVPDSAIVKVGVNNVVFLKTGDNQFMLKKVQTLPSRLGKTPVKGLMPGQTIVTRGGYELKYILPTEKGSGAKAAGHFHADGKFHEGSH